MEETPILVDQRAGYRVITFNRPQRLNAFTEHMHKALAAALTEAESDASCRAPAAHWEPGADSVRARISTTDWRSPVRRSCSAARSSTITIRWFGRLRALPFPVGRRRERRCGRRRRQYRLLASDIVLAARYPRVSFSPSPASAWCPTPAAPWFLPRLVGMARARRACPARRAACPAEKAESWGLIWRAVDDGLLMTEAEKICAHFASAPTVGLALTKRALDASETNDLADPARSRARPPARGRQHPRLRRGCARCSRKNARPPSPAAGET